MTFRPTLAADASYEDYERILAEGKILYASPKLDGIRCIINNGQALSRTLKPIRNQHIQKQLTKAVPAPEGLDGELIVGKSYGEKVFARSTSGVMSAGGDPDFTYHVFDTFSLPLDTPYRGRLHYLKACLGVLKHPNVQLLEQRLVTSMDKLLETEREFVEQGYEGVILRWNMAPYKFGKSTLREGYMLKLKGFEDREAIITGFEELLRNANEATIDSRGLTVRGSSKFNKIPAGTLGALEVTDTKRPEWSGLHVGTGFDSAERQYIWDHKGEYLGKIMRYRYQPVGTKDLPRQPVWHGIRHPDDL